jgi:N-acetyl-anhydromuramyl-L-alanine amidase AmpD
MIAIAPLARLLTPKEHLRSSQCSAHRLTPPAGVMVHFDDSSEDRWAVAWFRDPTCHVSYNRLYLDDGAVVQITPSMKEAAWHAGVCLTKSANSLFYGLAIATDAQVPVKPKQLASLTDDVIALFRFHDWPASDVERRLVGHDAQAIFNPKDNPKRPGMWGQLGRKIDPTGLDPKHPILNLVALRAAVRAAL